MSKKLLINTSLRILATASLSENLALPCTKFLPSAIFTTRKIVHPEILGSNSSLINTTDSAHVCPLFEW